jgi:hypothetical protein
MEERFITTNWFHIKVFTRPGIVEPCDSSYSGGRGRQNGETLCEKKKKLKQKD